MEIQKRLLIGARILFDDNGAFWRWWYQWTTPPPLQPGTDFAEREQSRRARLASAILLSGILMTLLAIPLFLSHQETLPLFIGLVSSFVVGVLLNRWNMPALVGILLIAVLEIGIAFAILISPHGISVDTLPLFYSLVVSELVAVSLLPPFSVFVVMMINSIFIWLAITFLPHSPEVGQALTPTSYVLFAQLIFLHLGIAVATYFWVRNATQAMLRADRAEEITHLQQTLVEQNKQRLEALQAEREITLAYEQQRKINALKDQFLIHVSHELRTPLTTLGGFLELIKMFDARLDTTTRASFLLKSVESFHELSTMVDSVLDVTMLASEISLALNAIPLVQAVQEVLDNFDLQEIQAHIIHLNIEEQIKVWANADYLKQVLHHLISNALKYSPAYSFINIEVHHSNPPSLLCICIQDEGPGIPPEEAPLLFDKFVRLERDLARAKRGLGLGLYITKTLVEAMQGHIWIESTGRKGEGSRFCFTLPSA